MKRTRLLDTAIPVLVIAAASFGLSACDDSTRASAQQQAAKAAAWTFNSAADPAQFERVREQDMAITGSIENRFSNAGGLSVQSIDIDTSNGHVVLRGYASSTSARDHATELAKSVGGVVSVDNLLHVRA